MFYSIASLIDPDESPDLRAAWNRIGGVFQSLGVELTRMPHLSWHVSMGYDFSQLDQRMIEFVRSLKPFVTHTTGIGVFSGPQPVVYLPVVKTRQIIDLHEALWAKVADITTLANRYYAPDEWIPHITLAYEDSKPEDVIRGLNTLISQPLDLNLRIDHLEIIYRDGEILGRKKRYALPGNETVESNLDGGA